MLLDERSKWNGYPTTLIGESETMAPLYYMLHNCSSIWVGVFIFPIFSCYNKTDKSSVMQGKQLQENLRK